MASTNNPIGVPIPRIKQRQLGYLGCYETNDPDEGRVASGTSRDACGRGQGGPRRPQDDGGLGAHSCNLRLNRMRRSSDES